MGLSLLVYSLSASKSQGSFVLPTLKIFVLYMLAYFYWDPSREMFSFPIPFLDRPILWYGFFFAFGFFVGYIILLYLLKRYLVLFPSHAHDSKRKLRSECISIADRLMIYVVIGAIIGARFGDLIFYQNWSYLREHPLSALKVWEGGLASHGGSIGIMIALLILGRKIQKTYPMLSWFTLLDLVVVPTAFAGCLIRIGNFFNQEILGTQTTVPWAVIFGHAADGTPPVPRHPVQLYEAAFYLLSFVALLSISQYSHWLKKPGKITGLFLVLVFGSRLLLEILKLEQSALITGNSLVTMGQYLSIPFVLLGVYLLLRKRGKRKASRT